MHPDASKALVLTGKLFLFTLLPVLMVPEVSWAVQQHGGTEGLVSHQLAHILFISGMFFLLYRLHNSPHESPGWSEFRIFIWLIICWNLLTFYGHWHRELIDPEKLISTGNRVSAFRLSGPMDILFYFSRLDHLLLLPAFLFLLAALIKWKKYP